MNKQNDWKWFNDYKIYYKKLNDAFCNEHSPLELKYIEGAGLGVFAKTDLKKEYDKKSYSFYCQEL